MNRKKTSNHAINFFRLLLSSLIVLLISLNSQAQDEDLKSFNSAIELFQKRDFKKSGIILLKLTRKYPDQAKYWLNLGNVYYSLERYPEAIKSYQKVISLGQAGKTTLTPLAQLYLIKAFRRSGDRASAVEALEQLKSTAPPKNVADAANAEALELGENKLPPSPDLDVDALMNKGFEKYQNEEFETAIKIFHKVMKIHPNADASMMLGMCYLRLSDPNAARIAFDQSLKLNPSPSIRSSAKDLINQIQKNLWTKEESWWAWVDGSYGSNSNVYENGASETQVSSPEFQASASIGYHLLQSTPVLSDLSYQYNQINYADAAASNYQAHTVQTSLSYNDPAWLLQMVPYYQIQNLAGALYQTRGGATATIQHSFEIFGIGVTGDFSQSNGSSTYSYLTGPVLSVKPYLEYSTARLYVSLYYQFISEKIGDMPYNTGTLPLADTAHYFGMNFSWLLSEQLQLQGIVTESLRQFTNFDTTDKKYRIDTQSYAYGRFNYYVLPSLALYLSEELIVNQSTLGSRDVADKNFLKSTTLAGLTWNIVQ